MEKEKKTISHQIFDSVGYKKFITVANLRKFTTFVLEIFNRPGVAGAVLQTPLALPYSELV